MSLRVIIDFVSKNCTEQLRYDRLGRLVLSQNAIQKPYLFSYTKYDALGRIIEVGQLNTVSTKFDPQTFVKTDATLQNFIRHWHHGQVTHTFYDSVEYSSIPVTQINLRKRVASITYEEVDDSNFATYDNAIHYSYDIEGNVATLINDNPHNSIVKQRYKRTDYYYDLVSGKVNELIYEHDSADQFMHIYEYDADNRITDVITSRDSAYFEHDAGYEYYDHGPLAREVLGQRQVQGVDYAYTLNGWLKGVNSSILNPSYDMGQDGNVHYANATIGRDAMGFTLEYFNGDYRAIGASKFAAPGLPDTALYNGNIAGATYSIKPLTPKTIGYKYTYDQLNRLNDLVAFTAIDTVNDKWNSPSPVLDFQEKVVYDENGNIFKYLRHGNTIGTGTSLAMDSLNYHYTKGKNQLTNVRDGVPAGNYPNDIDDEPSPRNYAYNKIGELAHDSAGKLDTITWTVYGKIKKIKKHNGDSLVFEYDGLGNRIEKRHYYFVGTAYVGDTTMYQRDAAGNILAVYDRYKDTVSLSEWDLYGGKRIGSLDTAMRVFPKVPVNIGGTIDSTTVAYLENQKQYELTNHLGNVLVTVSDRKWAIDTTSPPTGAKYYMPNIVSSQDYYPFGMLEPGRNYQLAKDSSYNFGYQGSMKDNQIYGAGNAYATIFRELDDRLGRWWSLDPKSYKSPWESPYVSMSDNPIWKIDTKGDDNYTVDKKGNISKPIKTKDKFDQLFATDDKGKILKNKSIIIPKGTLEKKTQRVAKDQQMPEGNKTVKKDVTSEDYQVKNDQSSKALFVFLAESTDVEWSLTRVGDVRGKEGQNILTTSHEEQSVLGSSFLINEGYKIVDDIHNHNFYGNSGPSPDDGKAAKQVSERFPNATFELYFYDKNYGTREWTSYDQGGVVEKK